MVLLERMLSHNRLYLITRSVSSKYPKPHPRPYRRRLFEAAVKPILPETLQTCGSFKEIGKQMKAEYESFMPIELALVDKICKWIKDEEFRVMAVCQRLHMDDRTRHFIKNGLRLKDIHYAGYSSKIMKKIFENTPLQPLQPLLCGEFNCFLFGRDLNSIKVIVDETATIPQIVPLVFTYDARILPMNEVTALTKFANFEDIRAETVQILQNIPADLTRLLDHQPHDLVALLNRISS